MTIQGLKMSSLGFKMSIKGQPKYFKRSNQDLKKDNPILEKGQNKDFKQENTRFKQDNPRIEKGQIKA